VREGLATFGQVALLAVVAALAANGVSAAADQLYGAAVFCVVTFPLLVAAAVTQVRLQDAGAGAGGAGVGGPLLLLTTTAAADHHCCC